MREEIILGPTRFLIRVLIWPKYILSYPLHEGNAEKFRYVRIKAEYLRSKPIGYQLSKAEEQRLRNIARQPVREFKKTLRKMRELEITPLVVKRSLATAYLSLMLGVFLQPMIVLAAKSSDKLNAHFYQPVSIVQVEQSDQLDYSGLDPPKNVGFVVQQWSSRHIR